MRCDARNTTQKQNGEDAGEAVHIVTRSRCGRPRARYTTQQEAVDEDVDKKGVWYDDQHSLIPGAAEATDRL